MDTISEFLTRIRNALQAGHLKVDIPNSRLKEGIALQLKKAGYIKNYTVAKDGRQGMMRVYLKYDTQGKPAITRIDRLSRSSVRRYVKARLIPSVLSGYGLVVLSTCKGVMSGKEAQKQNTGGELLCQVW